jgi:hypothetical protein
VTNFPPSPRWQDPRKRLEVATLVLHYRSHYGFLGDEGLRDRVDRLDSDLPDGSTDISCGGTHVANLTEIADITTSLTTNGVEGGLELTMTTTANAGLKGRR